MKHQHLISYLNKLVLTLILSIALFACGSGSTSNNNPVNNTSISTTLPNGTVVTIPVNQLSATAGTTTTTSIMVSNAPSDFKMHLSYNNVTPSKHKINDTNEAIPILATFNPENVTGSNTSVFSVTPRRDLTTGNYPITVSITYINNGHESTTTMDPLNISVVTNTDPLFGTINLTPESITVGSEESKNILLSLNNSINVTNLTVSVNSTNPSVATVTPSNCKLSTESPNCILTITGVSVESTTITATAANYQDAASLVHVKNIYAYVTNEGSSTISMFRLNSTTGQLIPLSPESSVSTINPPFALSIAPSGKYLYATTNSSNSESDAISMFSINPQTGYLTPLSPQTVQYVGDYALSMLINPLSGSLYTSTFNGSLSMFNIESTTGLLSPLNPPSVENAPFCLGLALSPNAKFLYSSCLYGYIVSYTVESSGVATLSSFLEIGAGLTGSAINQSGNIMYTLDINNNRVLMFAIDQESGGLTQLSTEQPISTQNTPLTIILTKANRFAYVTNLYDNSISMYNIDKESGTLVALSPESTVTTQDTPWSIALDPSEKFAYAVNSDSGTISAYSINQVTGKLTPLDESSVITGKGSRFIQFN